MPSPSFRSVSGLSLRTSRRTCESDYEVPQGSFRGVPSTTVHNRAPLRQTEADEKGVVRGKHRALYERYMTCAHE
jgi:hypothetical protein